MGSNVLALPWRRRRQKANLLFMTNDDCNTNLRRRNFNVFFDFLALLKLGFESADISAQMGYMSGRRLERRFEQKLACQRPIDQIGADDDKSVRRRLCAFICAFTSLRIFTWFDFVQMELATNVTDSCRKLWPNVVKFSLFFPQEN